MKLLKRWLVILQNREYELMDFTEKPHIKNSPDYWFYLELLNSNKRLQVIAQDRLVKLGLH